MSGGILNRHVVVPAVLTLGAALVAALVVPGCGKQPEFNVVVITIDTLRGDHVSSYGYAKKTTPRIDAFAQTAALFEQVVCQSPQTLPSHASIFTGQHPRTHKAISHESVVDAKITTLAEVLKHHGYVTCAVVSSHVLDAKYGLNQGFDFYWPAHSSVTERARNAMHLREDDPTTDWAVTWVKDHAGSRFFLWVHWFHPHRPYSPPARYIEDFAGTYSGPVSSDPDFLMKVWKDRINLPEDYVRHMRGLYDGEVAFSDAQVGRLLDELEALDILKNTVVVITSDHGEILYDHEYYFGHDIALYDESIMIPLIVHVPTLQPAGKRVTGLVQSIDIFPTILEALSITCPEEVEGKSLVPLMAGGPAGQARAARVDVPASGTVEYAFSETFPFPEKCPPRHAVRSAEAKLMWIEDPAGAVTRELYDLKADPGETRSVLYEDAATADRLDSILVAWVAQGGLRPAPIPSATESGRWKILKSLGYLD